MIPSFIAQKGGPYSPNTLQEHMALILRGWAGIEKASSHGGRRSVITDIIHKQKKSLKVAQKVAGHKSASTTVIYDEPPEEATSPGGHPKSPTDGHLKIPHLRT